MNLEFYVLMIGETIEESVKNHSFLRYLSSFRCFSVCDFRNAYLIGGKKIAETLCKQANEDLKVKVRIAKIDMKLSDFNSPPNSETVFGRLAGPNNVG